MSHEGYHKVETGLPARSNDIEYYLTRLAGYNARLLHLSQMENVSPNARKDMMENIATASDMLLTKLRETLNAAT